MTLLNRENFIQFFGLDMTKVLPKPTIIKLGADWCIPCKQIHPVLEALEKEHPEIDFYEVDLGVNQELAEDLHISSIPTMFFLKGEGTFKTLYGYADKKKLEGFIEHSFIREKV